MRIATPHDAAALLAPVFAGALWERVAAVHLSADRLLLAITLEQVGDHDQVVLPVRALVASALRLGSEAVLVAHNHPSGNAQPSGADRQGTRRLADALGTLGIRLLDHLIFAGGEVRSMAALGLL